MCGVVGVYTKQSRDAVECCASLIFRLQHRGQDGAGIVSFSDKGNFEVLKGRGLVQEAVADWTKLTPSFSALAHTRYATTGIGGVVELQPFVSGAPKIAMAHNGNISNAHEIKENFVGDLKTESDLELLQEEFLLVYSKTRNFKESVTEIMNQFEGGFAVVGILENGDLFGFRDPFGIRPLYLAESDELIAFASETGPLELFKNVKVTEVMPGEWVRIREGSLERGFVDSVKNPQKHKRSCMFESVYFSSPQSSIDGMSVYRQRFQLGRFLAKQISSTWQSSHFISEDIDYVVPVPETSRVAATAVAEELRLPFREFLIKNPYVPRTFILSSQEKRLQALGQKMSLVGPELRGKRILLVDDSVVRGNTSRLMALRLREAGAKAVYLASTCPPIVSGCYYGIDFPDQSELIAHDQSIDQVAKLIGVDGLYYLNLDGLKKALGTENLCTGCLTGVYPYSDVHHSKFVEERRKQRCL